MRFAGLSDSIKVERLRDLLAQSEREWEQECTAVLTSLATAERERDALLGALRGTRANLRWMYAGVRISEGDMEVIQGRLREADAAIAALEAQHE